MKSNMVRNIILLEKKKLNEKKNQFLKIKTFERLIYKIKSSNI